MRLNEISTEQAGKFFMEDPLLCERALPDNELLAIKEGRGYCPLVASNYIGIYHDYLLICVVKWEYFTDIAANIHPYMSSPLHGKRVTMDVWKAIYQWFIVNTKLTKLIVLAPASCLNVHKAATEAGFIIEGRMSEALTWRGKVDGLNAYGLSIDRTGDL